MKITKRQLRRIIKEAIGGWTGDASTGGFESWQGAGDALPGDPHYSMKFGMDVHDSVIGILSGTFMGGRELAARAMDELIEFNVTENEVFTVLDEMLEGGTVIFDVEEDEWSLP